jgi:hypothetical protein
MLRELDFIEGEWPALFWALSGAAAILRHAASAWRKWLKRKTGEETGMNDTGKKLLGVGLGILSALALVGCALAGLRIISILFRGWNIHSGYTGWQCWRFRRQFLWPRR